MRKETVIVLLSGGLNSAVIIALALKQGYEVLALSIHYGQCHARDLRSAQLLVDHYSIKEYFVSSLDLHLWTGLALTGPQTSLSTPTPMAGEQFPVLYVPNRNMIFLSIALSLAEARGAKRIYIGLSQSNSIHHRDSTATPESFNRMLELASIVSPPEWQADAPLIETPLHDYTKLDVVRLAVELNVPIELTWSCCQSSSVPCGVCPSCRSRDRALIAVGLSHLVTPLAKFHV